MLSAQDYDVWLRLSEKYEVRCVNLPLVVYYFHEGEQITKDPTKKIAGLERIIEKNQNSIMPNSNIYWRHHISLVPWYAKNKQFGKAFGTWFRAAFKCPLKFKGNLRYLYAIFRIMVLKDRV